MPEDIDFGEWQPRKRDLCQHCGCDWHGLVCRSPGCYCLGSHLLEKTFAPDPDAPSKAIVKKEQT